MSPKYHPELAGLGIEYTWGYSKMIFRGLLNDCVAKRFKSHVVRSLSTEFVGLATVRRYARRTRDYRMAYKFVSKSAGGKFKTLEDGTLVRNSDGLFGWALSEKMRTEQKLHRCIMDIESAAVRQMAE